MGEVYLAEDTKPDRKVALKILPPQFAKDKDRMNRFVHDAKSASALNHPNIITIYEISESEGTHFIATEFIDAHTAGVVHRDMKPDKVMVRASGLVKILDFGIAKLSEARPVVTDQGRGERK